MQIITFSQQFSKYHLKIQVTFYEQSTKQKKIPDNSYLVSLDVRSLCTSIPNSKGIKAFKTSLENFPRSNSSYKSHHYFFIVNFDIKQFCVQLQKLFTNKRLHHGNNLRTNIFMDHFERKYIYPFLERLSLSYLRFIGNMFFIWTGSKDQLITFSNDLNTKHNSIKSEYKISQSSIPFLDIEVYIKNELYKDLQERNRQTQLFAYQFRAPYII